MAGSYTTAHISTARTLASTITPPYHHLPPSHSNSLPIKRTPPRCSLDPQPEPEPEPEPGESSRRVFSISLVLLHSLSSLPPRAIAGSLFDKYVKKKKLEPLETYVPAVILTQLQIKDFEKSLEVDQPQYAVFRSILRSGPAASFRSNVRAVAQYASDDGKGKTAFDDVDRCLRALDELDSLLLRASRNNPDASTKLMKEKINVAVNALDSLLQTVPIDVLDKGRAIAEAYRTPESDVVPEELDREFKDLESIL